MCRTSVAGLGGAWCQLRSSMKSSRTPVQAGSRPGPGRVQALTWRCGRGRFRLTSSSVTAIPSTLGSAVGRDDRAGGRQVLLDTSVVIAPPLSGLVSICRLRRRQRDHRRGAGVRGRCRGRPRRAATAQAAGAARRRHVRRHRVRHRGGAVLRLAGEPGPDRRSRPQAVAARPADRCHGRAARPEPRHPQRRGLPVPGAGARRRRGALTFPVLRADRRWRLQNR